MKSPRTVLSVAIVALYVAYRWWTARRRAAACWDALAARLDGAEIAPPHVQLDIEPIPALPAAVAALGEDVASLPRRVARVEGGCSDWA